MVQRMLLLLSYILGVFLAPLSTGPVPVPPDRIRTQAQALLSERFPGEAARLRVRVLRTGGTVEETAPIRLSFPEEAAVPRGHTQVDVLSPDSTRGWRKTGWALLYVAHYDSVLVARVPLEAEAALTDAHVSVAWMETTRFRGEPLRAAVYRTLRAAHPIYVRHALAAGRVLRSDDVRPPYATDTGQAVVMHYRRGDIDLRLTCKAREPGYTGDVIRLYYPDTRTTYRARLTGPGTAEWVETR